MFDHRYEKDVAITGIGQSEVGRPSNKSAMRLTLEACLEAIADAGLQRSDIDGVGCWPGDNNNGDAFSPVGPSALKSALGLNVNWFGGGYEGPGPLTGVINGAMAIAAGLCKHVLVFRTITEASARLVNKQASALTNKTQGRDSSYAWQWFTPFNVLSATNLMALYAQRHFHEYGTRPEQLAQIALTCRQNAMRNPKAVFRTPMSMEDYMASRMISTPLRMFDCDVHCDASTAIVLSRRDIAQDQPNQPIRIEAMGAALNQPWSWDQISLTKMAAFDVGQMMWARTDYSPQDVESAQLYDGFSILTLIWLEALGLCPVGESGRFVEGGTRIALDGSLPINTNGGQLSGGRTHGLGYVHEACLQLWGRAEGRQTREHRVSTVAAGGGPLGGSLLLVRE
ncbi:thiolase family protein [Pseudomonas umsongensis]|jgi:acetyl-CoA acetyltransferase|uniref:DitF protein n=1 Tax=Pseudomonas umsongensis TaxID=198618 RepID=A0ABX4DYW3_9PSED|nr:MULTISPECIES: thiolase family protein [Pseudomonas]KEX94700.1 DitF protein [Pseudomonas putida]MDP9690505.1 acetyl-CoA acetyltransferase [Pseudomonas mohnii]EPA96131.1 acetyl-CoA acetyltransferase [Pseudomonas sp. G5(2012)]NWL19386.1 thiolase family protein [Pseudomonas umsongensis]OXR34574.1 DitF protein [Pseudomonas umsongensis]